MLTSKSAVELKIRAPFTIMFFLWKMLPVVAVLWILSILFSLLLDENLNVSSDSLVWKQEQWGRRVGKTSVEDQKTQRPPAIVLLCHLFFWGEDIKISTFPIIQNLLPLTSRHLRDWFKTNGWGVEDTPFWGNW